MMEGTPAVYQGRIVDKNNFRVFIYGPNGQKKLVESWDEFEATMQSGVWFANIEDIETNNIPANDLKEEDEIVVFKEKPKSKSKRKPKQKLEVVEEVNELESVLPDDGSVFEVTDNFLSKECE